MSNRQELIDQVTNLIPEENRHLPNMGLTKDAQVVITDGEGGTVIVDVTWLLFATRQLWDTIEQLAQMAQQEDNYIQ